MNISRPSNARLRTRSGCLDCRKRRKKCDEKTPRCSGCTRNNLKCTWPTDNNQTYDSRKLRGTLRKRECLQSLWPQLQGHVTMPFTSHDHRRLFAHFASVVFPDLLRPDCDPEQYGKDYFLHLALQFPPLMGTVIAIAALRVDPVRYQGLALECHMFTLQDLQNRLATSKDAGNEDGLLATTIFLCLFETSQRKFQPSIGAHANAASAILSRRNTTHDSPPKTSTSAIFEKLCAESLLYHSTLMMLFDPSLDALYNSENTINLIGHFFNGEDDTGSAHGVETPILVTSHKFFLLISEVTRLARTPRPQNDDELLPWACLQAELWQREKETPCEPSKQLFILAMQILLLRVYLTPASDDIATQISNLLSRGLDLVDTLDTQKYFPGYLLWPLTVFGSVASGEHERGAIKKSINHLVERQYGQAVRIYVWLQHLWVMEHQNKTMAMMCGLEKLLDGTPNINLPEH